MSNSPATPRATIVFDLDGTLVDTAPDLVETLNVILRRENLPALDYKEARLLVGGGAKVMLRRGLEREGVAAKPDQIERMFKDFVAYYSAHIADHSKPFDGLEAALDRLAARGFILAVCTNKLEGLSLQLLDALKLRGRFAAICGPDTFGMAKPDPQILLRTIAKAGGAPSSAVLIGDSETDLLTARNAKVPMIAMSFGYSDPPVASFSPEWLIDHYDALEAAIEEAFGGI